MKKLISKFSLFFLVLFLLSSKQLFAQDGFVWNLGLGMTAPTAPSDFNEVFNNGFNIDLSTQILTNSNLRPEAGVTYSFLSLDKGNFSGNVSGGRLTNVIVRANLRYYILLGDQESNRFYITGGYSRYLIRVGELKADGVTFNFEDDEGNGYNFGLGFDVTRASNHLLFIQLLRNNLFTDGSDNLVVTSLSAGFLVSF